jgi:hypothetical protein
VFIDGRADMYGPEILEDYMTVCRLKPGWKRVLDKYFIDWILCPVDQPLAAALGETGLWKRIHADETSAIFSRRAQN